MHCHDFEIIEREFGYCWGVLEVYSKNLAVAGWKRLQTPSLYPIGLTLHENRKYDQRYHENFDRLIALDFKASCVVMSVKSLKNLRALEDGHVSIIIHNQACYKRRFMI